MKSRIFLQMICVAVFLFLTVSTANAQPEIRANQFVEELMRIAQANHENCDLLVQQLNAHLDKNGEAFFKDLSAIVASDDKAANERLSKRIFDEQFLVYLTDHCKSDVRVDEFMNRYIGKIQETLSAFSNVDAKSDAAAREALLTIKTFVNDTQNLDFSGSCGASADLLLQLLNQREASVQKAWAILDALEVKNPHSAIVTEARRNSRLLFATNGHFWQKTSKCIPTMKFAVQYTRLAMLMRQSPDEKKAVSGDTASVEQSIAFVRAFFTDMIKLARSRGADCESMAIDLESYVNAHREDFKKHNQYLTNELSPGDKRLEAALDGPLQELGSLLSACEKNDSMGIFLFQLVSLLEEVKPSSKKVSKEDTAADEMAVTLMIQYFKELDAIANRNKGNCEQMGTELKAVMDRGREVMTHGLHAFLRLDSKHAASVAFSEEMNHLLEESSDFMMATGMCRDNEKMLDFFADFLSVVEEIEKQ